MPGAARSRKNCAAAPPSRPFCRFFHFPRKTILTNAKFLLKYDVLLRARSYGEMAELVEGARLEIVYTL